MFPRIVAVAPALLYLVLSVVLLLALMIGKTVLDKRMVAGIGTPLSFLGLRRRLRHWLWEEMWCYVGNFAGN